MNAETRAEVLAIVKELGAKETADKIETIKKINPVEALRLAIFNFYEKRLATIEQDEMLKSAVESTLLQKIANNELTVPQLISLARGLRADSTMAIDSLLSILKPVPNTTNPLMDRNKEESEGKLIDAFHDLTSEDTQSIETLTRVIREIKESNRLAKLEAEKNEEAVEAEFKEVE